MTTKADNPRVDAVMRGDEGDLHAACWALVESAGRDAYENAAFWRHIQEAVRALFPSEKPGWAMQRAAADLASIEQEADAPLAAAQRRCCSGGCAEPPETCIALHVDDCECVICTEYA